MMTAGEVGAAMYTEAGLDAAQPARASLLAKRLHGRDVLYLQPKAALEGALATVSGRRRIVIRQGTSPARANYLIASLAARLRLEPMTWYQRLPAETQAALVRDAGAWVVAPDAAFRRRMWQTELDIHQLGAEFAITETCATMRIQEVGGPDTVVTTPERVWRRGRLLGGFADEHVRELAARRSPKSVRKVAIQDEPGRVALVALTG
jgi:hypothetical protein